MSRQRASADVFQAIADPTRRALLDRLREGQASANDLAAGFRISQPAISRHLRVLRESALVRERRDGRHRIYELTPAPLRDLAAWVEAYRGFWQLNLENLKRHMERE
jgi:DNA-binding transcriptional ArsR family regulator